MTTFKQYLETNHKDIILNAFQLNFVDVLDNNKNIVLLKSRQIGASFLLDLYSLYTTVIGSPVYHISSQRSSADRIESKKYVNIFSIGYSENRIRGLEYGTFIIHNFELFTDKMASSLLSDLSPYLTNTKSKIIIYGSGASFNHPFYNLTCDEHNSFYKFFFTLQNANQYPDLKEYCKRANDNKTKISKKIFDSEYNGIFYNKTDVKSTLLNVRLTPDEKEQVIKKAKQFGFSTTSDFAKNALSEVCRNHLFSIDTSDHMLDFKLTTLCKDITFDEDKVSITVFLDKENTWKKYVESVESIKIWWLDNTGEKIDYILVDFNKFKFFPIQFSHSGTDALFGKFILYV